VRFQILMAMSMKMAIFWDIVPCSPVDINRPSMRAVSKLCTEKLGQLKEQIG
jgi:hypothetical protein